jgi:hypothetical protein
MAELTEEHKNTIVLSLAGFMTPAAIRVMMKETYGLDLEYGQITTYDPTKPNFRASERWREIFELARKKYVEETLTVPVSNQGYRMRTIQKMLDTALEQGNMVIAMQLLEQAAKEVGGLLTNARNVNVSNQGKSGLLDLSPDERRQQAAEIIREALARRREELTKDGGVVIEHQSKEGT